MGSQYLINQSLHTQSGSQDVHLSVQSRLAHLTHALITCGDAFQPEGLKHTCSI